MILRRVDLPWLFMLVAALLGFECPGACECSVESQLQDVVPRVGMPC